MGQRQTALRVGGHSDGTPATSWREPYKLERRRETRREVEGRLPASYSDGSGRFGVTHLELTDRSDSGIGATTRTRLEPGMIVTICPEGSTVPWITATAVRCRKIGKGYSVGLRLGRLSAA